MSTPSEARLAQLLSAEFSYAADLDPPARPAINIVSGPDELERSIQELKAENAFLKDHIKRQNVVVRSYQEKGTTLTAIEDEDDFDSSVLQDWISELSRENQALQDSLSDFRLRTEAIAKENEALHIQLRDHSAQLLRRGEQESTQALIQGRRIRDAEEWAEAHERIDLLTQENDILIQQTRALQEELQIVRDELATVVDAHQVYTEIESASAREAALANQLQDTARRLKDCQDENLRIMRELGEKRVDSDRIAEIIRNSEAELEAGRRRELDAIAQLQQQASAIEELRSALEQTQMREQAADREIQRMTQSLARLTSDSQQRIEEEKEAARKQAELKTKNIEAQLRAQDLEIADLRSQLDRAAREFKTLQTEMKGVVSRAPTDSARAGAALDDALSRLTRVERERDEARLEAESATASINRQRAQWDQQRTQLVVQTDDWSRRARAAEAELNQLREERARLSVQVEQLSQKLKEAQSMQETFEQEHHMQVAQLTSVFNTKVRELEMQLQDASEIHQRASNEMQDLLSAQNALTDKWREESKKATARMEHVVHALKEDAQRQAQRADELSRRLSTLQAERADMINERSILEREIQDLSAGYEELHAQRLDAEQSIQALLSRDTVFAREKQDLLATIDRLTLERDRIAREVKKLRTGRPGESILRRSLTEETEAAKFRAQIPEGSTSDSDQ